MHGQRRMAGLVLAAALTTAFGAAPSKALWIGPERASPEAIALTPDQGPDAGWYVRLWSWCTALFAAGEHTTDGHTYVGRNFDMEIDPVFDTEKVVMLFHPRGGIPFASVAWPGMTGVVTGMNRAGIFVAVHGGRASSPSTHGVPVPTTVRTVLERAHSLDDAIAIIRSDEPMVSHILFVVDGDRATARVYTREILTLTGGGLRHIVGAYDDQLTKTGGTWLFSRRAYRILHDQTSE